MASDNQTPENCSHNCEGCSANCEHRHGEQSPADFRIAPNPGSNVRKVIAVASGKGGVGKSLVTSMLAVLAQRQGLRSAILDADVTGPSIPKSFGLGRLQAADGDEAAPAPAVTRTGIEVMSLNLLLDDATAPVVWRGPVISGAVGQFWSEFAWGDVDIMFVDMPPGTGDVPLTVFQSLPVAGVVVVVSPQELVGMIVEKAVRMAGMMNIPVLGLVENMSGFKCPDCGAVHQIFGESHAEEIAARHGIPVVCRLPLDPAFASAADAGRIEDADAPALAPLLDALKAVPAP